MNTTTTMLDDKTHNHDDDVSLHHHCTHHDDEYTFQLKREYATEKCMHGVMEWAVDMSQDAGYNPLVDGGPVPVPSPVAPNPNPNPTPAPPVGGPGTCGGGTAGNGVCADASLCCSEWGWCGASSAHCANTSAPVTSAPVATPAATSAPVTSAPIPSPSAGPSASPTAGPTTKPPVEESPSPTAPPTQEEAATPTTDAPTATPSRPPTASPAAAPTRGPVAPPGAPPTDAPATSPPTGTPVIAPQCIDHQLTGNWGGGGAYDCAYYNGHGGTAYCAHAELNAACCFCGGGDAGGSSPPAPAPACTDGELPPSWSGGGVWDCAFYDDHGGVAYCAHAALKDACCFCGGGVVAGGGGSTSDPTPSPTSSAAAVVCSAYTGTDRATCVGVQGCSWNTKEAVAGVCMDAPLAVVCQQWNGKKNRCKNEGCKWNNGSKNCKGYWG